ncbi:hypothetical protein FEM48_Zijuj09G0097500 [Ziziphus jujuba var. spinosa]|uniref:Uncharacterized protein n=1 Tax=Ziziphus jujuba var. spinosa TaxID=714518 RepID=A0A978USA1_ZIZJJ|nr:hypothetical protein FEM48_Zijuj09G0097500 [Ziziphus jujuba var. spinosa]
MQPHIPSDLNLSAVKKMQYHSRKRKEHILQYYLLSRLNHTGIQCDSDNNILCVRGGIVHCDVLIKLEDSETPSCPLTLIEAGLRIRVFRLVQVPILSTSVAYGVYMAVSSNLRSTTTTPIHGDPSTASSTSSKPTRISSTPRFHSTR